MSGLIGNSRESFIGDTGEVSTLDVRPGAITPDSTGGRVALYPAASETSGASANPIFVERQGTTLKFYQYGSGVDAGNAFGFFVNLASCGAGIATDFTPGSANTPWIPRTGGPVSSDLEISNNAPRVILRNTTPSPVGNAIHIVNLDLPASSTCIFAPGPVSGTYGDLRPITINLTNGNITLAGWAAGTPAPIPNMAVQGTATFAENVTFAKDVTIIGALTSSTPNTFNTPVTFKSTTTTVGLATFTGGINVSGPATFSGSVSFGSSFTFSSDIIVNKASPQVILKDSTAVSTAYLYATSSATGKGFFISGADSNTAPGPNANRPFWINLASTGGSVNVCNATTDAANPSGFNCNGNAVFLKDVTVVGALTTTGNVSPYRLYGSFSDGSYNLGTVTLAPNGTVSGGQRLDLVGFSISVPGCVPGDFVMLSPGDINFQIHTVKAIVYAGLVSVQMRNLDSTSVTITARTFYARVFRR